MSIQFYKRFSLSIILQTYETNSIFAKKISSMFLTVLLAALILIAMAFMAIGIKMFVKKGGQFERRCENEGSANCLCGGKGGDACKRCQNRSAD